MTVAARPPSLAPQGAGHGLVLRSRIEELGATDGFDPLGIFAAARSLGEDATIWLSSDGGPQLVAIGALRSIHAAGAGRVADVARSWAALVDGAVVEGPADVRAAGPLLLGGFGFADAPATSAVWRGFETAILVVPRVSLSALDGRAWLTTNVDGDDADLDGATDLWRRVREAHRTADRAGVSPAGGSRLVREVPEAAEWQTTVARLAGAVGRGRLDKVVLARRVDVRADEAFDLEQVLRRLAASAPESTVFGVSHGLRTFLGATPERLVATEGGVFRTVAMAGSAARGQDAAADDRLGAALMASEKEREEHRLVVEMLRDTLGPLADQLSIPNRPSVRRFRHVQHLVTEIEGRLRDGDGALSLVARLHPTPAVGGTPRQLALELIAEQERIERGWYAGPIGWVDRHGDGEFVVGIRSGMVEGSAASLFAGCGIVADSDPAREWQESVEKLQALAAALGVVVP